MQINLTVKKGIGGADHYYPVIDAVGAAVVVVLPKNKLT